MCGKPHRCAVDLRGLPPTLDRVQERVGHRQLRQTLSLFSGVQHTRGANHGRGHVMVVAKVFVNNVSKIFNRGKLHVSTAPTYIFAARLPCKEGERMYVLRIVFN